MDIINIKGMEVKYEINKGKRKNVYLSIQDGRLLIKTPLRVSQEYILKIIKEKENWILDKYTKHSGRRKRDCLYNSGEFNYFLGKEYEIKVLFKDVKKSEIVLDNSICIIHPEKIKFMNVEEIANKNKKLIDKLYKEQALIIISEVVNKILNEMNLKVNDVKVQKFKRIWGNCSSKKHIKINQDVIFYDGNCIEYVCLHEICHLKYMNHSKKFWDLISTHMPDYKIVREKLKY